MDRTEARLNLHDLFGEYIATRNAVKSELVQYCELSRVVLDFSDVRFISRSSADEILRLSQISQSEFLFENMNQDIEKMFLMVKKGITV